MKLLKEFKGKILPNFQITISQDIANFQGTPGIS